MDEDRQSATLHWVWRDALDSLRLLGRRAWLALLGIAVGCAAIIALINIGHNAAVEAINAFKGLGTNTLVASFRPGPENLATAPMTLNGPALTATLPEIQHVAPLTLYSSHLHHAGTAMDAAIVGTSPGLLPILGLQVAQGRFLSDFDRESTYAVVGSRVAQTLGLTPGSWLQIAGYLFEVIGIATSQPRNPLMPVTPDDSVFVPIEGMRRLIPSPQIGSIVARVHDSAPLARVADDMKTYLERTFENREVDVQIPKLLIEGIAHQANTFAYLLAGMGGISLLVGGVGVMNVMFMNVTERRREIGVRLALGARARDIRNLFLFEAIVLSVTGALLGTVLGLGAAYAFVRFSGWTFDLSALSLPLGILCSLGVGLFFGLYPALTASRLPPVSALRDD